ncbi:hypothetical protein [Bacteroides fragilis]|mgnify:FL=1|jgi:hypothetical protein|uniref:hypothetical protein n=1 Tax=Bacteroides fragilis TaxID=817 RepID=UPI00202FA9CF|nr:hypothetical protein [Bacteroides fragilis]MCM0245368.1 hypothetical protein [Bacteroides fragilis]MCM0256196.1 hypothetical protein [Bacteroides fragilis]
MKHTLIKIGLFCCLLFATSCVEEELQGSWDNSQNAEIGILPGEEVLHVSVLEKVVPRSRSLLPLDDEGEVTSLFYLFFDQNTKKCVAYSFADNRTGLNLSKKELPLLTNGLQLGGNTRYNVKVIVNYRTYMDKNTSGDALGQILLGQTEDYVRKNLYSSGLTGNPTVDYPFFADASSNPLLLYTGEFEYQRATGEASCLLNRKMVSVTINWEQLPDWMEVSGVSVTNIPKRIYLFGGQSTVEQSCFTEAKAISWGDSENKTQVQFYMLPHDNEAWKPINVSLDCKKVLPKSNLTVRKGDIGGAGKSLNAVLESETVVTTDTYKMYVNGSGYKFEPNQWVYINFFESQSEHGEIDYTVNGWSSGGVKGTFFTDGQGNEACISETRITLDYADQSPVNILQSSLRDGSVAHEVFISSTGFIVQWTLGEDVANLPSWLSVERHDANNSLILTAQPNFSLNEGGILISSGRKASFTLSLNMSDGSTRKQTIIVTQLSAPSASGDVEIDGLTVSGRNTESPHFNFYGVTASGVKVGDWKEVITSSEKWGDKGRAQIGFAGKEDNPVPLSTSMRPWSSETVLQQCSTHIGSDWRMVTGKEFAFKILPRLRSTYMSVGGHANVQVVYLPTAGSICFFPVFGQKDIYVPMGKYLTDNSALFSGKGQEVPNISVSENTGSGWQITQRLQSGEMRILQAANQTHWGNVRCVKGTAKWTK